MKRLLLSFSVLFISFGVKAQTDAINIIPNGNVGIGSTAPVQKLDITGSVNVSSGYRIGNGATSGNYLRGNGTEFVSSAIQAGDIPTGSGNYIQNQLTTAQTTSNFWISNTGRAAAFQLNNANTSLTEGSGDALRMTTPTGYIDIGSQNASWAHIQTDRPRYYMNVGLTVDQGLIGSYDEDLSLQTSGTTRITVLNSNGNVGIGSTAPTQKLTVAGNINKTGSWIAGDAVWGANTFEIHNNSWDGASNNNYGGITGGHGYYYGGLQSGGGGGNEAAAGELYVSGKSMLIGSVGVGLTIPLAKLHVSGGGQIIGTNGTSSNTRTLTILEDGDTQTNFGSYPGAWTSALQIQSNDPARYIWLSPITSGGNARLVSIGSDFEILPGNTLASTFSSSGDVTTARYHFAQYFNSSDNAIGSGVTSIMAKAGDNYFRSANAAAVASFLGTSLAGNYIQNQYSAEQSANFWVSGTGNVGKLKFKGEGGNSGIGLDHYAIYQEAGSWSNPYPDLAIGFHTGIKLGAHYSYNGIRFYNNSDFATQTFSVGDGDNNIRVYYNIATVGDIVSNQNYGLGLVGLYDSFRYQNIFSMGASYRLAANGTTPGNLYGIAWTHTNVGGQSKSGLGHQALFMDNGVTQTAIGNGIWTRATSWIPFIYDLDNTSYYLDANSTSRQSTVIADESYSYGWFRNYNTNQGLYNQATGRHFYSESGSYWTVASGNGLIFRNSHAGTVMGYSYHDGGSSFGSLSPNGNWRFRCDNTNSEAYGSGFYAPTSYIGFIYDRDNTGYYLNPNGDSQTSSIYNNNWFRAQGSSGFYFQDYGGGWQMTDGTWIRAYNSKPILATGGIAGYGNAIVTWFGIGGNMVANYNNATGAGVLVSDDGGFGDWNDAWVQFRGSNGLDIRSNNTSWNTVFRMGNQDNSGTSDKLVTTGSNAWGLMGGSGNAWWQSWSYSFNNASLRELKKDITPVKGSLGDLVMADLDKMTPYLYRYNEETDEWSEQNRAKFRTGLHMGLILDETPDYIQSQSYTGVDIYAVASLGVAAGKYNREEIKQIKQSIGLNEQTMNIQDFGSMQLSGKEMYVSFSSEFTSKLGNSLPVVTITSNDPTVTLSVTEKSAAGFKVISSSAKSVSFDYIAMAKVKNTLVEDKEEIAPEVMNRIRVSEDEKVKIRHYWDVEAPEKQKAIEENARIEGERVRQERIKETGIQVGDPAKESGKIGAENAAEIKRIADEARRNYIAVPEDAPAKSGTLANPNPSKEGAPQVQDLKPTPTSSLATEPPPADSLPGGNK